MTRDLEFDDVKHLMEKEGCTKLDILAEVVGVASKIYYEENKSNNVSKKRKNNPSSSPDSPTISDGEILMKKAKKDTNFSPNLKLHKLKYPCSVTINQEIMQMTSRFRVNLINEEKSSTKYAPPGTWKNKQKPSSPISGPPGTWKYQERPSQFSGPPKTWKYQERPPQFSGPPKTWKYQEKPSQFSGPPKSWKYPEISKRCVPKGITSTNTRQKASSSVPKKRQLQVDDNQGPQPRLPQDFEDSIRALAGGRQVSEPVIVAHKKLFSSDVCPNQSRFLFPALKLKRYLTEDENRSMPLEGVQIIEPNLAIGSVTLGVSKMHSDQFVLRTTWNRIVVRNSIKKNMIMQLWAFRIDNELKVALVHVPDGNSEDHNGDDLEASSSS